MRQLCIRVQMTWIRVQMTWIYAAKSYVTAFKNEQTLNCIASHKIPCHDNSNKKP